MLPNVALLSPPVHFARWAHMRRFLSVCLSVNLIKIHISESIIGRSLKLYHSIKHLYVHLRKILATLKNYF